MQVSKTSAHNDLVEPRQEAAASLGQFIENSHFEGSKSRTSIDLMIGEAYENDFEFDHE